MHLPLDPDDPRWNELLASADPMSETGPEFEAAILRLQASLAQLQSTPGAELNSVAKPDRRWSTALMGWTTAAIVLLAIGGTLSQWWFDARPQQFTETEKENKNGSQATSIHSEQGPAPPSVNSNTTPNSTNGIEMAVNNQPALKKYGREQIRSVQELLMLTPSQFAKVQRRMDHTALNEELRRWLIQWQAATPEQRSVLEEQWVACRGFWSGWTIRGLREWKEPTALQAGIEILSMELGASAPEQLGFCLQREETAGLAAPFLIPRANDAQLVRWLPEAQNAETVHALAAELASRSGQVATEALAVLAADQVCQQVLRQAALKWHPAHAERALSQLTSPNSQQQFLAAMILSVIEQEGLDQELLSRARSGVQALPALSAYVFRHQDRLEEKLQPLQESPSAWAAIPSAQQRSQKWQRQQSLESPGPKSLRKVCQLCVSAS
ncbi:MAG: hypothetical protein JNL67_15470 [Planctomycetaceae bacterium]|nr:hypothetical protein [Planctomycetaceae bacterium]